MVVRLEQSLSKFVKGNSTTMSSRGGTFGRHVRGCSLPSVVAWQQTPPIAPEHLPLFMSMIISVKTSYGRPACNPELKFPTIRPYEVAGITYRLERGLRSRFQGCGLLYSFLNHAAYPFPASASNAPSTTVTTILHLAMARKCKLMILACLHYGLVE
jgi:hypothetical protein